MTLGKKLTAHRKASGFTQQQLGELLNVSAQAVSKWENDQAEPDLHTLRKISILYRIKIDDLLFGEAPAAEEDTAPAAAPAEAAAPAAPAATSADAAEAAASTAAPAAAAAPAVSAAAPAAVAAPAAQEATPPPPPASEKPAAQPEKKLIGYCSDCGCAVYSGLEKRLSTGLYCTTCYAKKLREARKLVHKARQYESEQAAAEAQKPKPLKPYNQIGSVGLAFSIMAFLWSIFAWLLGYVGLAVGTFLAFLALGCSIRGMVKRHYCCLPGITIAGLVISIVSLSAYVLTWIFVIIGLAILSAAGVAV